MVFHISNNNEILKVPQDYYNNSMTVEKFANTSILEVVLFYDLLDRKPEKLINIELNRCHITSESKIIDRNDSNAMKNFCNYSFCDAEQLALRDEIPVPRAPVAPTGKEKQLLYNLLKAKYPKLWEDCSYITEHRLKQLNEIYEGYKSLVKEAYMKKIK